MGRTNHMRFKLVGGGHNQGGRDYVRGDVVDTDLDLVAMFGTKFQKYYEEEEPPEEEVSEPPRGIDSTEKWPLAVEEGFTVFRRGAYYHVYEGDSTDPLNSKGVKKGKVKGILQKALMEE